MLALIIGGSGSGKSAFAERLAAKAGIWAEYSAALQWEAEAGSVTDRACHAAKERNATGKAGVCQAPIYIASMEPFGQEGRARIARHRAQREAFGFSTLERFTDLAGAQVPAGADVLLEDLSNLLANEMFSPTGALERAKREGAFGLGGACPELPEAEACPELPEKRACPEPPEAGACPELPETGACPGLPEAEACPELLETGACPGLPEAGACPELLETEPAAKKKETDADRTDPALAAVRLGISCLEKKCRNLVIVTNEVFSGGSQYGKETLIFLKNLAALNREIASRAELVVEVVCGIPKVLKGSLPEACPVEKKEAASMIFVTGPLSAGKREYIRNTLGMDETSFAARAVWDVQDLVSDRGDTQLPAIEALADSLARKEIVIATEVGGGVVPTDPKERAAREAAGRLACLLAARADVVIRVCCGLPQVLKGEWPRKTAAACAAK